MDSCVDTKPVFRLQPEDGPSFERHGARRNSRWLLVCDHARNRVPRCLGDMGVAAPEFERHLAYDIGAEGVTRHLADLLDAPALIHGFTRLALDPNRQLNDPALMPPVSDGVVIPANRHISHEEQQARIDALFRPYHLAIADALSAVRMRGELPILLSIHSFTPEMDGFKRPWQVGVLWDRDKRLAAPFIKALEEEGLVVGDNEPYSRQSYRTYTVESHAEDLGLPNLLVEVRQDLIETEAQQKAWAERLFKALPKEV